MAYEVKQDEYSLIKDGDYEAIIEEARIAETKSGIEILKIKYRIRSDVEQEYKNRIVFETIWKDKIDTECFNKARVNKLLNAIKIPVGKTFNDTDELIKNGLLNGALRIHVTTKFNSYLGKDENVVYYYKPSDIVNQKVGENEKEEVIDTSDLPF